MNTIREINEANEKIIKNNVDNRALEYTNKCKQHR